MGNQYGSLALSDGVNFLLQEKSFDYVQIQEALYPIGRWPGVKATGQRIGARTIDCVIRVFSQDGTRAGLERNLDALYLALNARQQQLQLHANDTRYWIADAVYAPAKLSPGMVVSCPVQVRFLCQQPYALSASPTSSDTGTLTLTNVAGSTVVWITGVLTTSSPTGTVYSYPQITLTNKTAPNALLLNTALTLNTVYTTISVQRVTNAILSGDMFELSNGVSSINLYATAAVAASGSATTIPCASMSAGTNFTANANYAVGNTVTKDATLTAVSLTQITDGVLCSVTTQVLQSGDQLVFACDPTASQVGGGMSFGVFYNGATPSIPFAGTLPVLEPGTTSWQAQVTANSVAQIDLHFAWTPRYLS